ncbi:MAG: biotin transporter BioY [Aeromicrobium sp.]|uniref:biotin transporter BioY n=1 Tax=Aeromicrobium sp. TaxID=1871063 RepID=UPI0039E607FE
MTTPTTQRRFLTSTDLALIATFAAILAVVSPFSATIFGAASGTPTTLQMFAVFLAGAVLGPLRGFLSVVLYLAIGIAGLPVFAGGAAGLAPFSTQTSGYLLTFPLAAAAIGFAAQYAIRRDSRFTELLVVLGGLVGELVVTLAGALSIALFFKVSYSQGLAWAAPFVPIDLFKLAIAVVVAMAVHRAFPQLLSRQ